MSGRFARRQARDVDVVQIRALGAGREEASAEELDSYPGVVLDCRTEVVDLAGSNGVASELGSDVVVGAGVERPGPECEQRIAVARITVVPEWQLVEGVLLVRTAREVASGRDRLRVVGDNGVPE